MSLGNLIFAFSIHQMPGTVGREITRKVAEMKKGIGHPTDIQIMRGSLNGVITSVHLLVQGPNGAVIRGAETDHPIVTMTDHHPVEGKMGTGTGHLRGANTSAAL